MVAQHRREYFETSMEGAVYAGLNEQRSNPEAILKRISWFLRYSNRHSADSKKG